MGCGATVMVMENNLYDCEKTGVLYYYEAIVWGFPKLVKETVLLGRNIFSTGPENDWILNNETRIWYFQLSDLMHDQGFQSVKTCFA